MRNHKWTRFDRHMPNIVSWAVIAVQLLLVLGFLFSGLGSINPALCILLAFWQFVILYTILCFSNTDKDLVFACKVRDNIIKRLINSHHGSITIMNEFDIGEIVSSTDSCFDKEEVIREVFDAAGDSKIRLTTSMNEALITIDCGTNTNPVPTK